MQDSYTYLAGYHEFPSLKEAQEAYKAKVDTWEPCCYDKCTYHGDSMIGLKDRKKIVEIKFLMNHKFCNSPEHHVCEYLQMEEEGPCRKRTFRSLKKLKHFLTLKRHKMKTQSHFEQIYLCVECHPDRCIVAAFTNEKDAEDFCNHPDNFYQGTKLYEVWYQGLNDYRITLDEEEII